MHENFPLSGADVGQDKKKAVVDEVICAGCGVCYSICPQKAITQNGGGRMMKKIL